MYSAFGLSLRSSAPIPGLAPLDRAAAADTEVLFEDARPQDDWIGDRYVAWHTSDEQENGTPSLRVWRHADGHFRFRYADGTDFHVDAQGTRIRAACLPAATPADAAIYLLGPVLGLVLALRGTACLHASVVASGDRAIALLGAGGAGKSTTAAALSRAGLRVLADDVAAVTWRDGVPIVQPAFPQLRLWPESVALLLGDPEALPLLTPTWDKRALDVASHFETRPLRLAAAYVLGDRSACRDPRLEPLTPRDGLMALLAHSYSGHLLDAAHRRREFETFARLAGRMPLRRIVQRADPPDLGRLCTLIIDDLEALACTASPITAR